MLDEWIRKSRELEDNNSFLKGGKSRYVMVIIICLGILALLWPVSKVEKPSTAVSNSPAANEGASLKTQLTADLESILSQVDGAGKVEVSLTLSSDGVKSYASNRRDEKRETEETDAKGLKKNSQEENLVQDLAVSSGSPLLVEEKFPQVLGVLVVADGARKQTVQENLTDAAATLLNIPAHRVRVLPRKGETE
ncbi:MAG: hypothetical protein ABFD08_03180 [Syntrophomonas sp.]